MGGPSRVCPGIPPGRRPGPGSADSNPSRPPIPPDDRPVDPPAAPRAQSAVRTSDPRSDAPPGERPMNRRTFTLAAGLALALGPGRPRRRRGVQAPLQRQGPAGWVTPDDKAPLHRRGRRDRRPDQGRPQEERVPRHRQALRRLRPQGQGQVSGTATPASSSAASASPNGARLRPAGRRRRRLLGPALRGAGPGHPRALPREGGRRAGPRRATGTTS